MLDLNVLRVMRGFQIGKSRHAVDDDRVVGRLEWYSTYRKVGIYKAQVLHLIRCLERMGSFTVEFFFQMAKHHGGEFYPEFAVLKVYSDIFKINGHSKQMFWHVYIRW